MNVFKLVSDAATVSTDLAAVAAAFADVPPALTKLGADVWAAVQARSAAGVQQVIADANALRATVVADNVAAGPLLDKLTQDLSAVLADLQ